MLRRVGGLSWWLGLAALVCMLATPAGARLRPEDPEYQDLKAYEQEVLARMSAASNRRGARPAAIPDIFGPGAVLDVGNVVMKVTNNGILGNPLTQISSDPSCQWPGKSAVEYMNFCLVALGAVNPFATDPNAVRRVSLSQEWRPATLDPEDRMYRGYDGVVNGLRFINDDSDPDPLTGDGLYDEDFLDGRDNDGDGSIDEDFAAIGQQMYTCTMRDDTEQAIAASTAERHVPLGVELRQTAWAYSIPGFTDFNVVNWKFLNRSGHVLDSVGIGFRVDMDCGPTEKANYFSDDFDVPSYPFGRFLIQTKDTDLRKMASGTYPDIPGVDPDSALCPRFMISVQGFSVADDDTDENKTNGVPHLLLIDHTIDPLGETGPRRVGFRAYRSFPVGQPYVAGGNPIIDQQRFELMMSHDNVSSDPSNPALFGFISQPPGDQRSDYTAWATIGPWLQWQPNAPLECTFAIGVRPGVLRLALDYSNDYQTRARPIATDPLTGEVLFGMADGSDLIQRYPALDNAIAAQVAFEGSWESREWPLLTDAPGRETAIKALPGQTLQIPEAACPGREPQLRTVTDRKYEWFDFDCDYCTGAYSSVYGGLFHRVWLAESPPPNPNTNLSVTYNYTANPDRQYPPSGNNMITLAWDNLSEGAPDPKTGQLDFRGYQLWKVSDWIRPVGSGGPAEDDWTLMATYRWFNYADNNMVLENGTPQCPEVHIPQANGLRRICLERGDLWDPQSGDVIKPDRSLPCVGFPGPCVVDSGLVLGSGVTKEGRTRYPVGRYQFVDRAVKNGFLYFYSITGFDSTGQGPTRVELAGRRSAVEAEGVSPQGSANLDRGVWVVPNPYRGLRAIQDRPSAWDLTPNATDPTGTHVDFMGLPSGTWTIKIFTLAGDLVNTLHSGDDIDASTRGTMVIDSHGQEHRNTTKQQDTANDGQARWNLISRNGQDVVSGIYLFTVESAMKGVQRGKFIIIR